MTHFKVSLSCKMIYRPESCLIIPKTLLPVSICCLGYQSETKPCERRFHISAAPADFARTTDMSFMMLAYHSPTVVQCVSFFLLAAIQLWSRSCSTRRPECTGAQWRRWRRPGGQWCDRSHRLNCLHTCTNPLDCLCQRKDTKRS